MAVEGKAPVRVIALMLVFASSAGGFACAGEKEPPQTAANEKPSAMQQNASDAADTAKSAVSHTGSHMDEMGEETKKTIQDAAAHTADHMDEMGEETKQTIQGDK